MSNKKSGFRNSGKGTVPVDTIVKVVLRLLLAFVLMGGLIGASMYLIHRDTGDNSRDDSKDNYSDNAGVINIPSVEGNIHISVFPASLPYLIFKTANIQNSRVRKESGAVPAQKILKVGHSRFPPYISGGNVLDRFRKSARGNAVRRLGYFRIPQRSAYDNRLGKGVCRQKKQKGGGKKRAMCKFHRELPLSFRTCP